MEKKSQLFYYDIFHVYVYSRAEPLKKQDKEREQGTE